MTHKRQEEGVLQNCHVFAQMQTLPYPVNGGILIIVSPFGYLVRSSHAPSASFTFHTSHQPTRPAGRHGDNLAARKIRAAGAGLFERDPRLHLTAAAAAAFVRGYSGFSPMLPSRIFSRFASSAPAGH